jgi:ankyrin repeat protein
MKKQLFLLTLIIYSACNLNAMTHHAVNTESATATVASSSTNNSTQVESKSDAAKALQQNPLALIDAAYEGDLVQVQSLIVASAQINIQDEYGVTALDWAARRGRLAIVEELIAAGAQLNIKNNYDYTALRRAAMNGHLKVVKALVTAGADIDAGQINQLDHRDAVWEAIEEGQKDRKWSLEF